MSAFISIPRPCGLPVYHQQRRFICLTQSQDFSSVLLCLILTHWKYSRSQGVYITHHKKPLDVQIQAGCSSMMLSPQRL